MNESVESDALVIPMNLAFPTIDAEGVTIAQFAGGTLGRAELARPVIDRTELAGRFDIHLEFL